MEKFDEGFFIRELMEEQDPIKKVEAALGQQAEQEEETKEESKSSSRN